MEDNINRKAVYQCGVRIGLIGIGSYIKLGKYLKKRTKIRVFDIARGKHYDLDTNKVLEYLDKGLLNIQTGQNSNTPLFYRNDVETYALDHSHNNITIFKNCSTGEVHQLTLSKMKKFIKEKNLSKL